MCKISKKFQRKKLILDATGALNQFFFFVVIKNDAYTMHNNIQIEKPDWFICNPQLVSDYCTSVHKLRQTCPTSCLQLHNFSSFFNPVYCVITVMATSELVCGF